MKKRLFFCFATALLLVGCGKSREKDYSLVATPKDTIPAVAEVTTSLGNSYVVNSVNGSGYKVSGSTRATLASNKLAFPMYDDETATIHFYCDSCKYDVTETVHAPFAKMFACNCPDDDVDKSSNTVREYLSVTIYK